MADAPIPRRLVVHIGLEKTGTTSFQRFCAENRAGLAEAGILYPRYRARRRANHAAVAAVYLTHQVRDYSVVAFAPKREAAVRALKREIERSPAPCALLSAEHFSSRFDATAAGAFARDFAAYQPRVVVAVRDLHGRFLSSYATAIEAGGQKSIDDYADEVLDPRNPYLDIAATLAPWTRALGADRLTIVDYDAQGDVVTALLEACGAGALAGEARPARRARVSMGPDGVRALRACNALIRARQGDPAGRPFPVWAQHTFFSNACWRAIRASRPQPAPAPLWRVSPGTLDRLDRAAERERSFLLREHGMTTRGAGDRARIVAVEHPEAPDGAAAILADALVRRVAGPLWPMSRLLVAAALAWTGRPPG